MRQTRRCRPLPLVPEFNSTDIKSALADELRMLREMDVRAETIGLMSRINGLIVGGPFSQQQIELQIEQRRLARINQIESALMGTSLGANNEVWVLRNTEANYDRVHSEMDKRALQAALRVQE